MLISLHRMNKILEVNEKDTYVVVEPGVSFYELSHYCRKNAPKVWPSVTTIAWGSVVGNVSILGGSPRPKAQVSF